MVGDGGMKTQKKEGIVVGCVVPRLVRVGSIGLDG